MSGVGTTETALAIDGGNVKTDVALVDGTGRVLGLARGGRSSPHALGLSGCLTVLGELVGEACGQAGLSLDRLSPAGGAAGLRAGGTGVALEPVADVAHVLLAGADFREEMAELREAIGALGWAPSLVVDNDTLALLRTGTDRGWGVAVVCGGGINAIGVGPDGREVRYPSLGPTTGDWGGGFDVGLAALGAAHRSVDGRGPHSSLERVVPEHFGMSTPLDVARALHFKEMASESLADLAPIVYAHAETDNAAAEIVARLADEVAAFAIATLRRLDLLDAGADVVLGGGLLRAAPRAMVARIERSVHAAAPSATVIQTAEGPIVGAALLGLDALGADAGAAARARRELHQASTRSSRG